MHDPAEIGSSSSLSISAWLPVVAFGLLAAAAICLWFMTDRRQSPVAAPPSAGDPRLTYSTPYRNVRPDVKYVGDEACAACHQDISETYRHHPMGQSFAPVARIASRERLDKTTHNPFEAFGFHYLVERQASRFFKGVRPRFPGPECLRAERRGSLCGGFRHTGTFLPY